MWILIRSQLISIYIVQVQERINPGSGGQGLINDKQLNPFHNNMHHDNYSKEKNKCDLTFDFHIHC